MSTFRMVHTEFWEDPVVIEEMTPEDKYFFLYLLTNPSTTQVGIYQITKKQMAFDMGYSMETINALLDRFTEHHGVVKYNQKTRELAIKNWGKFNLRRGGKPMLDCVKSELKDVKDLTLISYVGERVENESIKKIFDTYHDTLHDTYDDTSHDTYHDTSENKEPSNGEGSYDTSTIRGTSRGQYKEQEEDKEEDKEQQQLQEKYKDEFNNSKKQVVVADPSFGNLIRFYEENIGMITPFVSQELGSMTDDLNAELALLALQESVIANANNKVRYAQSILKSWKSKNFKTVSDVENAEKRREGEAKRSASNQRSGGSTTGASYEDVIAAAERDRKAWGG